MEAPSPSDKKVDPTGENIFESAAGNHIAENITDDDANNSPKNGSRQPPSGALSQSTTIELADGETSSLSSKKLTLPETPRWRFVSRAKKSEGYSSSAAGKYVIGKSGEELAGKFVAPVWNAPSEKSQEETVPVVSSDGEEEVRGKEERNVGKIGRSNSIEDVTETFEYAGKVVTKNNVFSIVEGKPDHDEVTENDQLDSLEKQSTNLEDELVEVEDHTKVVHTLSASALSSPSSEPLRESPTTAPVEDVPRQSKKKRRVLMLIVLLVVIAIAVFLGIIFGGNKSENENTGNIAVGSDGAFGGEKDIPSQSPTADENATSDYGGETENIPSQSPSTYCPANTKLFSIQYTAVKEEVTGTDSYPMAWALKESCSGIELAKCLPCADSANTSLAPSLSPSASIFFNNSSANATTESPMSPTFSPTMSSSVQPLVELDKYTTSSDGVSGCIPDGYEYVFEVKLSDNSEECCGFIPYSFTMSHADVVVTNEMLIFYDFEGTIARVSFPENAEPCPTSDPSIIPSSSPSELSTEVPSFSPSEISTEVPSAIPIEFSTEAPSANFIRLTFTPTFRINYPITNINGNPSLNPSENPSINPSENPSDNPSENPSSNLSKNLSDYPSSIPSEDPSENPSIHPNSNSSENPSENPSEDPTNNPSEHPSENPSEDPTSNPSEHPSENPSENPTSNPSSVVIIFNPSRRLSNIPKVLLLNSLVDSEEVHEHDRR